MLELFHRCYHGSTAILTLFNRLISVGIGADYKPRQGRRYEPLSGACRRVFARQFEAEIGTPLPSPTDPEIRNVPTPNEGEPPEFKENLAIKLNVFLVRWLIRIRHLFFYGTTKIIGRENIPEKGPVIVAFNHPNSGIDLHQIGVQYPRMHYCITSTQIFKTPISKRIVRTCFNFIPFELDRDAEQRALINAESFFRCRQILERGRIVYIAPEGVSEVGRRLQPLKPGAMYIALNAAQKQQFKLDLKVVPVGINYEAPYDFRSKVLIRVGEPISISDYAEVYRNEPARTTRNLTRLLEKRMRSLILDTQDEREDQLLKGLEEMLQNEVRLDPEEEQFRSRKVLAGLQLWRAEQPKEWSQFEKRTTEYMHALKKVGISDHSVARTRASYLGGRILLAIAGLPLFVYGWFNNFLPAWFSARLRHPAFTHRVYAAFHTINNGQLFFPVFYFLQFALLYMFLPVSYKHLAWFYLLSLAPAGLAAWHLKKGYETLISEVRFTLLQRRKPVKGNALIEKRRKLMTTLQQRLH